VQHPSVGTSFHLGAPPGGGASRTPSSLTRARIHEKVFGPDIARSATLSTTWPDSLAPEWARFLPGGAAR
jgi:hypothetical protein